MADAGLDDGSDLTAEGAIATLDNRGVLGEGDDEVVVAGDMQQRDPGLGDGGEIVDRVPAKGEGFLLVEIVGGEAGLRPAGFLCRSLCRQANS